MPLLSKIKPLFNFQHFKQLTKFQLSIMNSFMVFYGYYVFCPNFELLEACVLFGGNFFMALASQAKGQLMEIDEDRKMKRTSQRPLPSGKLDPIHAKIINYFLFFSSNSLLYFGAIPWNSIFFSNLTYFSYILYILLKKRTPWNTLFGSFVGSLPILVGMSACTSLLQMNEQHLIAFFYLFIWQFVHFYGIYISFDKDYKNTNFKFFSQPSKIFLLVTLSLLIMCALQWLIAVRLKSKDDLTYNLILQLTQTALFIQHLAVGVQFHAY